MSLLLDALKKAAADKEKASAKKTGEEPSAGDNPDVQIELPEVDDSAVFESSEPELQSTVAENFPASQDVDGSAEHATTETAEEEIELELDEDFNLEESAENELTDTGLAEKFSASETIESIDDKKDSDQLEIEQSEPDKDEFIDIAAAEAVSPAADVEDLIEKQQSETIQMYVVDKQQQLDSKAYNPEDARKVLALSQKRYRNRERLLYYGIYIFAAVLFFAGLFYYYSTESLDNSNELRFASKQKTTVSNQIERDVVTPAQNTNNAVALQNINQTETRAAVKQQVPVNRSTKSARNDAVAKKNDEVISITRQKKPDPISVLLNKAYLAYQSSDYSRAKDLYQQVLERDARQRDALLGIAAIAVIEKNYPFAKSVYQRILHYYPEDSIARSAQVDLLEKELSTASESDLKLLLRDHPQAAHVHFSLGLLYAKQQRINESQQAFFDAYVLEPKADYAFNLAVMLDRLQKKKAALVYYKKASELADQQLIHFDERQLLQRIEQLESGVDG